MYAKLHAQPSKHGALNARRVVKKIQELGISLDTMFLSWASSFNLAYLKEWLEAEKYDNFLSGSQRLLAPSTIRQYFMNLERGLFRKCFRNTHFPLQLSILFATLAANKAIFCSNFEISALAQNCLRHR